MRPLSPRPDALVDPATGRPRTGSFEGGLPPIDWTSLAGPLARIARHKKWVYVAVATRELYAAAAVLRAGYASSAFAYVYDAAARRVLARRSWTGRRGAAQVADEGGASCRATFETGDTRIEIAPHQGVRLRTAGFSLEAALDASAAPPALGAIAEVAPGRYDATEKRALLRATGRVTVDGSARSLDGGLAGYDFTSGLLARHTTWRWGFALGWSAGGAPFGLNLVQGFVGEPECAAWIGGDVVPLGEGDFAFDRRRPREPWHVRTRRGEADLVMTPGAVHEERKNLGLVRSRFAQPCGAWSGTLTLPGRPALVIERALGVTEDQDIVW